MKIGILISGRGSNMAALLNERAAGHLPEAEFCVVISNNPDAPGLPIARQYGVPAVAIDHRPFGKNRAEHEAAIIAELAKHSVDLVVLAGYMRLLTPTLIGAFRDRMMNIHPSLLPAFPGAHAQRDALAYAVKIAGCSVHFVTEEMDAGAIILQRTVPVLATDDEAMLSQRILKQEHLAYPLAVDLASRGRLRVVGRETQILRGEGSYPGLERELSLRTPILAATGNAHKLHEMRAILRGKPLGLLSTKEFPGIPEPAEDAPDYAGNACIKAEYWFAKSGITALADDSGLEVDALGGRPGVHSARYAETAEARIAKLLGELKGVPPEQRTARFACAIALRTKAGLLESFGVCEGSIAEAPSGAGGFGYDPIFIPEGFGGRHLAELSEAEKNAISHRGRALAGISF